MNITVPSFFIICNYRQYIGNLTQFFASATYSKRCSNLDKYFRGVLGSSNSECSFYKFTKVSAYCHILPEIAKSCQKLPKVDCI